MIAKKKLCISCNEEKIIWKNHEGNKYCQYCWNKYKATIPIKRKIYIKQKTSKNIKLDKEYSQLRRIFLTKHPLCMAAISGCQHNATDIHHKSLRGENYLKVNTWLPVCRVCHTWIHENPQAARSLDFLT